MEKIVIVGGNEKSKQFIKTMMETENIKIVSIKPEDTLPTRPMPVSKDIHYYEEMGDYIHPTKKQLENMNRRHK